MKKKWYLQTWFICIMFAFWFLIIPGIAGIVLLIMQILETNNLIKKYGHIDQLNNSISSLEKQIEDTKSSLFSTIDNLNMEIQKKKNECTELQDEILMLEKDTFCNIILSLIMMDLPQKNVKMNFHY